MSWLLIVAIVVGAVLFGFVAGCAAGHRYIDTRVSRWDRLTDDERTRHIHSLHPVDTGHPRL